jgi:hypothetical protein
VGLEFQAEGGVLLVMRQKIVQLALEGKHGIHGVIVSPRILLTINSGCSGRTLIAPAIEALIHSC